MAYLRKVWDESPERRQAVGPGPGPAAGGENWAYLIKSLPILEPAAAPRDLHQADRRRSGAGRSRAVSPGDPARPEDAEEGRREGRRRRTAHQACCSSGPARSWPPASPKTSSSPPGRSGSPKNIPTELEAEAARSSPRTPSTRSRSCSSIWPASRPTASPPAGPTVFTKAQCAKCHRFDGQGESFGPDLTTVASRFTPQGAARIDRLSRRTSSRRSTPRRPIRTTDGRHDHRPRRPRRRGRDDRHPAQRREGHAGRTADIEATKPSKLSSMPAGLLDPLTLEEIADLFAYLQRTKEPTTLTRRPVENTRK